MLPDSASAGSSPTLASALVDSLGRLGVRDAFGVSGGAIAALWHALSSSRLRVCHFRHESGAAFAACEASLNGLNGVNGGRPVVVFATTGPGLVNALTGLMAARDAGAQVILLSAFSSSAGRGRFAIQETSGRTMPAGLHVDGPLFHHAAVIEDAAGLVDALTEVERGLRRPGGFIAHLAMPTAVQGMAAGAFERAWASVGRSPLSALPAPSSLFAPAAAVLQACVRALIDEPFAIWLGFGARGAAREVRALAERTGAAVFCTPRAKGIFPETHPQFIGVTGMGGHESVAEWVVERRPARILVLGSRLGEASSGWDARFVTRRGFVHVDIDPAVPGAAYPDAQSLAVTADVGELLRGVLAALPGESTSRPVLPCSPPEWRAISSRSDDESRGAGFDAAPIGPASSDRVRPQALMDAIQRQVVDASDAVVLGESGNAFIWTTHRLRFAEPGRYAVSTGFGAMGHATAGVIGAALASGRRAVAVVGDGSMLMHNEINTAVKYAVPAVWVVLNDARYGMCAQGMDTLGLTADANFPEVDFVAFARSQGANGVRVADESQLDAALQQAMRATGPFLVDVLIDPRVRAPAASRNRALASQLGDTGTSGDDTSFPLR